MVIGFNIVTCIEVNCARHDIDAFSSFIIHNAFASSMFSCITFACKTTIIVVTDCHVTITVISTGETFICIDTTISRCIQFITGFTCWCCLWWFCWRIRWWCRWISWWCHAIISTSNTCDIIISERQTGIQTFPISIFIGCVCCEVSVRNRVAVDGSQNELLEMSFKKF